MFSTVMEVFSLDTVHYLDETYMVFRRLVFMAKGNNSYINNVLVTMSSQVNFNYDNDKHLGQITTKIKSDE
jgi:hypothetical protein